MKLNKKSAAILAGAAVLLLIGGLVVYAFLADRDDAINSIKVGNVVVKVNEDPYTDDNGNDIKGFDRNNAVITDGSKTINKPVRVENTGSLDCYIRVWVGLEDESLDVKFSASQNADQEDTAYKTLTQLQSAPYPENWTFAGGWFYYTKPVAPGDFTTALFTQVKAGENVGDDFDIIVYSEAVQTTGADGTAFAGYDAAWTEYLGE